MIAHHHNPPPIALSPAALIAAYRALGGALTISQDLKDPGMRWFGIIYPAAGRGAPGVGELLAQLRPGSLTEGAVLAELLREGAAPA